MITINEHYLKLQSSYLFSTISKKVTSFQKENPNKKIINGMKTANAQDKVLFNL